MLAGSAQPSWNVSPPLGGLHPAPDMSSDGEFLLVSENIPESLWSLERIRQETEKYKTMLVQSQTEKKALLSAIKDHKHYAEEFHQRTIKLKESSENEEKDQAKNQRDIKEKMDTLQVEASRLKTEVQRAEEELNHLGRLSKELKQQTEATTAMPEKSVVFVGTLGEDTDTCIFDMKPSIVFPMEGGTALITFEEEEVAQNILSVKEHTVRLGECFIRVQAQPVQFPEPSDIEMDTQVCPRRILVSNLPKKIEQSRLLDRLEIHFSKSRNGGGEVEAIEFLHDSGNVVITFIQSDVAKGLTEKQRHEIQFGDGKKHRVHVTPFLNGEITDLKICWSQSKRTVLLAGIPDIMDREELQDLLEIHFQKTSNGGGEVDAFAYNPLGRRLFAVFGEDCSSKSQ